MKSVTYLINSELDFQRVVSSLEESNISHTSKVHLDSTFPVLGQAKAFGEISVSADDDGELQTRIRELTNTEPKPVNQDNTTGFKWSRVWIIALIIYAVIISVVCLKYRYINSRNLEDKNYTYEWSYGGQDFVLRSKKTGNIVHRFTDDNYDLNFEESRAYSKDGINVVEWRDLNEDGFYEKAFLYNASRESTGMQLDMDNDGMTEQMIIILESKDTLKLVDTNRNGFLEIQK